MRVLLVRSGALGDLLLLRTALWRLRAAGHAVTLLAPARTAGLLVGPHATLADTLLDADSRQATGLFSGESSLEWGSRLRSCGAAIVYSDDADLRSALAQAVPDVRHHDPRPVAVHAAEWLCRPLGTLAVEPRGSLPDLPVAASGRVRRRPVVAIHPGSGSPRKNWPWERFAAVARALTPHARCLWIRGPAEREGGAKPPSAVEVLAELPLSSLASELSSADVFLGNDSGVSHLAAAVGTPTLALFGPTDPALWAPLGRSVRVIRAPNGRLDGLALETVLGEVRTLLPK